MEPPYACRAVGLHAAAMAVEKYLADPPKAERNIRARYFVSKTESRALLRNGVARLWWSARLSYVPGRDNPYELTSVLFTYLRYHAADPGAEYWARFGGRQGIPRFPACQFRAPSGWRGQPRAHPKPRQVSELNRRRLRARLPR